MKRHRTNNQTNSPRITLLIVAPNEEPAVVTIPLTSSKSLEVLVGGYLNELSAPQPLKHCSVLCNRDHVRLGLEPNRWDFGAGHGVIRGEFLVVGRDSKGHRSLTPDEISIAAKKFALPK